jgi:hypothetical protein
MPCHAMAALLRRWRHVICTYCLEKRTPSLLLARKRNTAATGQRMGRRPRLPLSGCYRGTVLPCAVENSTATRPVSCLCYCCWRWAAFQRATVSRAFGGLRVELALRCPAGCSTATCAAKLYCTYCKYCTVHTLRLTRCGRAIF